jgi:hypothetical protein
MVLPSIAGQGDIKKKQDMDLFQLLVSLPFVDPQKLTQKVLGDWNWSLDSIAKTEEEQQQAPAVGPDGQPLPGGAPAGMPGAQPGMEVPMPPGGVPAGMPPGAGPAVPPPPMSTSNIPPEVAQGALAMLRGGPSGGGGAGRGGLGTYLPPSVFAQASSPINLLNMPGIPPTAPKIPLPTNNPRGFNRSGKVNTNISMGSHNTTPESQLIHRATNLQ